jgi:hypothetical protein
MAGAQSKRGDTLDPKNGRAMVTSDLLDIRKARNMPVARIVFIYCNVLLYNRL